MAVRALKGGGLLLFIFVVNDLINHILPCLATAYSFDKSNCCQGSYATLNCRKTGIVNSFQLRYKICDVLGLRTTIAPNNMIDALVTK